MLLQPRDANNFVLPSATKIDAQIYTGSSPHSSRRREKLASPRRLNCGLDHVGLEFQPSVGESADFHFGLPQFFEFVRQPQFRDGENVRAQTFANWLAIDFTARVICSRDDVLEQIRGLWGTNATCHLWASAGLFLLSGAFFRPPLWPR